MQNYETINELFKGVGYSGGLEDEIWSRGNSHPTCWGHPGHGDAGEIMIMMMMMHYNDNVNSDDDDDVNNDDDEDDDQDGDEDGQETMVIRLVGGIQAMEMQVMIIIMMMMMMLTMMMMMIMMMAIIMMTMMIAMMMMMMMMMTKRQPSSDMSGALEIQVMMHDYDRHHIYKTDLQLVIIMLTKLVMPKVVFFYFYFNYLKRRLWTHSTESFRFRER